MSIRCRTLFGVILPPWKEEKLSNSRTLTLEFVIQDYFPSKKNKHIPFTIRKDAYTFIKKSIPKDKPMTGLMANKLAIEAVNKVYSKVSGGLDYQNFVKRNKEKLQEQMLFYTKRNKGLIFPLSSGRILCKFFFKTKYRLDTISKEESVLDILVAAGVLADDNRFVLKDASRKARSYKDEILEDACLIKITINKSSLDK